MPTLKRSRSATELPSPSKRHRVAVVSPPTEQFKLTDDKRAQHDATESAVVELATIATIPMDVLSMISFWTLRASSLLPHQGIYPLLLVCRQWHRIIMSDPRLWNWLRPMSAPMTSKWLARSRRLPLDLDLDTFDICDYFMSAEMLLEHFQRIRHINLVVLRHRVPPVINHASLVQPAPLLEHLSINVNEMGSFWRLNDVREAVALPKGLFSGSAPNLREVRLKRIAMEWTSSLLSGLTCLELHTLPIELRPSIDQILQVLAACPSLEKLGLRHALRLDIDVTHTDIVRLPVLRFFTFHGGFGQIGEIGEIGQLDRDCDQNGMAILRHILAPTTVNLEYYYLTRRPPMDFRQSMAPLDFFRRSLPQAANFVELRATFTLENEISVKLSASDGPIPLPTLPLFLLPRTLAQDPNPKRQRVAFALPSNTPPIEAFHSMDKALDFSNLQGITLISYVGDFSVHAWQEVSNACPRLEFLACVGRRNGSKIVSALTVDSGGCEPSPPRIVSFPVLRRLLVEHLVLPSLARMKTCFRSRLLHGVALETLEVRGCGGFRAKDRKMLGNFIAEIKWDGYEMDIESGDEGSTNEGRDSDEDGEDLHGEKDNNRDKGEVETSHDDDDQAEGSA